MKDIDVAWAAGFLDGEGCFHIGKAKSRNGKTLIVGRVKANQANHIDPIEKLHSLFGGQIWTRGNKTSTGKTVYEWQIQAAKDLKAAIPRLLPYLVVKKFQAELVLELAGYLGDYGRGGNPYGKQRLAVYDKFKEQAQEYANAAV